MAKIALQNGGFVIVDDADVALIASFKWYAVAPDRRYPGSVYAKAKEHGRTVWMHRRILQAKSGQQIDHIDRNGLNNSRENLRYCTQSQNNANRPTRARSGFRGVWKTRSGKYVAVISAGSRGKHGGRTIHIGTFATSHEAARAYDVKARRRFGEFATLNFPI